MFAYTSSSFLLPLHALTRSAQSTNTIRKHLTTLRGGVVNAADAYVIENVKESQSRLNKAREEMKSRKYDLYLLPSSDSHLSEYSSPHDSLRQYLTSFTGSAGTCLLTKSGKSLLWTDGRYWIQASDEVDSSVWSIMKDGQPSTPSIPEYIKSLQDASSEPLTVGLDPNLFSKSFITTLTTTSPTSKLEYDTSNLIAETWDDQPAPPTSLFRLHPEEYAGKGVGEKLKEIREKMSEKNAEVSVYSDLSEVSYILNLRGSDIECCPVCKSYCVVTSDSCNLYCEDYKIKDVEEYLKENEITVRPYSEIHSDIKAFGSAAHSKNKKVWIDSSKSPYGLTLPLDEFPDILVTSSPNPVEDLKSVKNPSEMAGMKECHALDGVAVARFASWCSTSVNKGIPVTEIDVDLKLLETRGMSKIFIEPSFPTIAGVSSNGAIIHYRSTPKTSKTITPQTPILIDSGGQYISGTTDATRTWYFGPSPPPHLINQFTRVLKGHISLSLQTFPPNTPGAFLDTLARINLWKYGYNYPHGTGHGVGASLNVHEGPVSISPRLGNGNYLKEGMVLSNEPGYYEEGEFGIRIENLLEVVGREVESGEEGWLGFEYLTMIPIQRHLIDLEVLEKEEREWLDEYHKKVWEEVSPLMEEGEEAKEWLWENTRPL
ncbi:hypothetical protein TrVE_jg4816 [Triparma verrucosa]|uniref:Uncharacterized protein n=1 Tax=Triparma verrucosa TaxID=1606542 RepID=A0A9W7BRK4_9STRA|nr:hypothetical protein TrVE_jg4816 [Triparma verrucosa]